MTNASNSQPFPGKVEIETALAPLIGLKLSVIRLGADVRDFHFGEMHPDGNNTVGQYALHVPGPWRIERETEILTGSNDLHQWKFGRDKPEKRDYYAGGSLQDALLATLLIRHEKQKQSLINATDQLVVERIEATAFGDATLHLSGGYRLVMFPTSQFSEAWSIFQPAVDGGDIFAIGDEKADRGFTPVTAANYLERAEDRFWGGDRIGAIADATEAIRLEPHNSQAYTQRGQYRDEPDEGDDYNGAIADFTEAIRLDPKNFDAYQGRELIYQINKEDYAAAIADHNAAIQIEPEYGWLYESRGFIYYLIDDNETALADLNKAIELEPRVDGYLKRARIYIDLGNFNAAIADCDAAISLEPEIRADNNRRGQIRNEMGDLPEIRASYFWRGQARDEMGDLDGAIEDYTKALKGSRWDADAYNNRAWAYYRKGNYEAALTDANAALKIERREWAYFHTRGMIYTTTNQVVRAISDFQAALDLEPGDPEALQQMTAYIAQWVKTVA